MNGMIQVDTDRIIRWSKDEDNKWVIQLIKDEENPESDGHNELRIETVLSTQEHKED